MTTATKNGTAPSQQAIDRASITARIEKAELDAYRRYREMDEYNTAANKRLQALNAEREALQKEHQQKNAAYSEQELTNRAYIDGLKATLGEKQNVDN